MKLNTPAWLPNSPIAQTLARGFPTLRFDAPIEAEFQNHFHTNNRPRVRLAVFLALLTVIGFAVLDHWLLQTRPLAFADMVRFGIQLPIVIACLVLTSARYYRTAYLPVIRVTGPLFGLGTVAMAVRAPLELHMALIGSRLVLVTFFFYFMLGLSFRDAVRCNVVVLLGYGAAAWWAAIPGEIAVYTCFLVICAHVFAGAGCYALEHANRVSFLEGRLLHEVATHDGLTGLRNRGAFEEDIQRVWRECERSATPVALVMIDIDHFKAYNDRYGHPSGDRCLHDVAIALQSVARRSGDIVARYGGEEMVALLPGIPKAEAKLAAQALVDAVRELRMAHAASPTAAYVSVSAGLAWVEAAQYESLEMALRRADRALYRAKDTGRDRCSDQGEAAHDADVLPLTDFERQRSA